MNWDIFIGRFHPLLVHLPIGIFILGYVFEIFHQYGYHKLIESRKTVIVTYIIGLLFGLFAAITGWLLSFSNDYGIESLSNHKLLGIMTLVVMLLVIIYQVKGPSTKGKLKLLSSTFAIILTGITGHLGGNLTHGDSYLTEYGPAMLMPNNNLSVIDLSSVNPDSVEIYSGIIKPIIDKKCIACHNSQDFRGGLIIDNHSNLFKDANHDTPIVAGDPDKSELLKRVSLPLTHEKFMPPRAGGFSYTEIQILRYWIENGADSLTRFNSDNMSKELIALVNRDYGLDFSMKPYYEKIKSDSLDTNIFTEIRNSSFRANYLGAANFLLDIEFKGDSIASEQISILNKVSEQITFLKLSNCKLSDNLVKNMNSFTHLTRIDLSKNSVTNDVLSFLLKHPNLESINLNGNDIDKDALEQILGLSNLLRVYVWNTKVSAEEISSLAQKFSNIEIISEFKFDEVIKAKSVFEQMETQ
jgi:uncharacterized membrane protein